MRIHASWRVHKCGSEEGVLAQSGRPAAPASGQDTGGGSGPPGQGWVGGPRHPQEQSLQGLCSGSFWTECTPTSVPLRRSLSPRRAWAFGRTLPGMQGFCGWECVCPEAGSFLLLGQWAAAQAWFRAYWERTSAACLGAKGPGGSLRLSVWRAPRAWTQSCERKLVLGGLSWCCFLQQ